MQPNPALALYDLWLAVLNARGATVMQDQSHILTDAKTIHDLATHRRPLPVTTYPASRIGSRLADTITIGGFDRQRRPVLTYGLVYYRSTYLYRQFLLDAEGRFWIAGQWGFQSRNAIAGATFLGTAHHAGKHRWFVDPVADLFVGHQYRKEVPALDDYHHQIPYVTDHVLTKNRWWELTPDPTGYRIVPALNQAPPGARPSTTTTQIFSGAPMETVEEITAEFEADAQQRERRYRRIENRRRATAGEAPLSVRAARVSNGTETLAEQEAVLQLAAHLDVTMPAKTTPLVRERL